MKKIKLRLGWLLVVLSGMLLLACNPPLPPALDIKLDTKEYAPGAKVKLSVTVTNFTLSQDNIGKANQPGMGHYRVYLDDKNGNDFLEEGAKTEVELTLPDDITPGTHVLKVVLLNNDNTSLAIPIEQSATFTVKNTSGPTVAIQADKNTVGIGDTVTLSIDIQNFKLVPISADPVNESGSGHYHLAFDNNDPEQTYLTSSTKTTFDLTIPDDISPGKHTLWVYLMNNNHTKLSPEVKASVTLEITGGTKPSLKVSTISGQEFDPGDALAIDVEVKNFKLVDPKTNTETKVGEGHYRVTLDDQDPTKEFLIKGFKTRAEVALPQTITPGPHKLVVHLVNNDGTVLDPPVSSAINIAIKGGAVPKVTATADKTDVLAGDKVNVTLQLENFTLSPISNTPENKANEGHYHIVLDDQDPEQAYLSFQAKETASVTIPSGTSPGPHKLWIYLMNNDHTLYVPTTKFSIDINVKDGTEPAIAISIDKTEIVEGGEFELTVKPFNFTIRKPVKGEPNSAKEGHYHVAFNNDDPERDYAMAPFSPTIKGTLPSRLKAGKHILWVYLMNHDHTLLKPVVKTSLTFTVKAK